MSRKQIWTVHMILVQADRFFQEGNYFGVNGNQCELNGFHAIKMANLSLSKVWDQKLDFEFRLQYLLLNHLNSYKVQQLVQLGFPQQMPAELERCSCALVPGILCICFCCEKLQFHSINYCDTAVRDSKICSYIYRRY